MRHFLAVALVATALAAESSDALAVAQKQDRSPEARGLVSRLTVQLRRVVANQSIAFSRQDGIKPSSQIEIIRLEKTLGFSRGLFQSFQLRLPPPQV